MRRVIVISMTMFFGLLVTSPAGASGATLSLSLPQGDAFSILGHSCGGIQEQSVAISFDPGTGYPTGWVYVTTTCSGSGRGGRPTTYSAWVTTTWDFTGAVVSFAQAGGTPGVDPTTSSTDASGNVVSTVISSGANPPCTTVDLSLCRFQAQLALAPGFVPAPRLLSLSSSIGPTTGGQSLTITGTGFSQATSVDFGGVTQLGVSVVSDSQLTVTTPPMTAGTVDVKVLSPGGKSATTSVDQYTFVARPVVAAVNPRAALQSGDVTVVLTGHNFLHTTGVSVGGVAGGYSVLSDSSLAAFVPPSDSPGATTLTVTSPGGTSAAVRFAYAPTTCDTQNQCEWTARCARVTGTLKLGLTLSRCSPRAAGSTSGRLNLSTGVISWRTSGRTTQAYLAPVQRLGRGACAVGMTEAQLQGAVVGGTSGYTAFGDAVFGDVCVTSTGSVSLVKGGSLLL